jgi:hypothetical protein
MKPSDLTADLVRSELEKLIGDYPERTGNVLVDDGDYDEFTCVYYSDEDGYPVSMTGMYEEDAEAFNTVILKTPVCIVGQWIETFHPEFKENDVIRSVLVRNATMRHSVVPFDPSVQELLQRAQDQQDVSNTTWGNIDLDKGDGW